MALASAVARAGEGKVIGGFHALAAVLFVLSLIQPAAGLPIKRGAAMDTTRRTSLQGRLLKKLMCVFALPGHDQ